MATRVSEKKILDTALDLAEQKSWEAVRLHDVAKVLNVSLSDVHKVINDKQALVTLWFDSADNVMLKAAESPAFIKHSLHQRVHELIMVWLCALATHRTVTRQMFYSVLEPGQLHAQIPAFFHLNRTVQWIREAVHRDDIYVKRSIDEAALTTLFTVTFITWLYDNSKDSTKTSQFLNKRLHNAEMIHSLVTHWIAEPAKHLFERLHR